MLTRDQIDALGEVVRALTGPITAYLLQDVARRIAQAGELTSTAAYQVWRSQQLGKSQREIEKELRRLLGLSHREVRRIFYQCAQSGYRLDASRFSYARAVPFEQNESLQQIVSAAAALAQEDFSNIVQTIGFVTPNGRPEPLTRAYIDSCDFAFRQTVTGAASYTEAVRQATRNLAEKGVRVIDYDSGVHTSLEAAVRRNILGGLGLMQEQVSRTVHDQLGCDGWEITAHAGSAPDHEPIQGKQYADAAYEALNNSLRRRIGTLNCGHTAFPIILGVNAPQYTPEELEKFRTDNERGVMVDGVHYTGYQAAQMQRKLELAIRRQKNRILVDEGAGDKEKLAQDKTKLEVLHQRYREFSGKAGLRTQYERTEVAGFGEKRNTSLANPGESGILNDNGYKGIPITNDAIARVPLVRPEGWTAEQAQRLQEAHRELLRSVKDKPVGIEAGAVYSTEMRRLAYRVSSSEKYTISLPPCLEPHILIHNHPDGYTFSLKDILKFGERYTLEVMTAVGNTGTVYLLEKLESYDPVGFSKALFLEVQVLKDLERQLKEQIVAQYLDAASAGKLYAEEINRFLRGGETYGVSFITGG